MNVDFEYIDVTYVSVSHATGRIVWAGQARASRAIAANALDVPDGLLGEPHGRFKHIRGTRCAIVEGIADGPTRMSLGVVDAKVGLDLDDGCG